MMVERLNISYKLIELIWHVVYYFRIIRCYFKLLLCMTCRRFVARLGLGAAV